MNLDTFFEKFNHFTEASNAIPKLREVVLRVAVRGKLVEQDPTEEPAELLLKSIKTAKDALVKERHIRKSNNVEYPASGEPFPAPPGWAWVHVDDVAIVQGGKRLPKGADFSDTPTPYIYIRVTDMKNGSISETALKSISETVQHQIARYTINKEDLYITIAGTIGQIGEVPDSLDGQNLTENAAKIVFRGLNKQFFQLALSSDLVQEQFLEKTKQMAQPKLALKRISGARFCLPPLAEQRRIVAKVNQLMTLIDQLGAQLQQRGTLQAALARASVARFSEAPTPANLSFLFHHSFAVEPPDLRKVILSLAVQGKLIPQDPNDMPAKKLIRLIASERDQLAKEQSLRVPKTVPPLTSKDWPYDIPASWEWARIGNLALLIDYGTSRKTGDDSSQIPVYRMGNIVGGRLLDDNLKYIDSTLDDLPRLYLKSGDILFNRTNSYELVGKTAIFDGEDDKATFASYLIRIRFPVAHLFPAFLNVAMNAPYFRQTQIEPQTTQQCGQANFNGTKLASTVVPVPPLAEQRRIVEKVDELMGLVDQLEEQLQASHEIAPCLVEAMAAGLTVKD